MITELRKRIYERQITFAPKYFTGFYTTYPKYIRLKKAYQQLLRANQ